MNHSPKNHHRSGPKRRGQAGLTLIEMLVALVIGALLIFGATQAYVDSRNAYAINETVSRMQETARYAMSVLEPEIRMSNFWGLMKGSETIEGKRGMGQAAALAEFGAIAEKCGDNFAVDLQNNVYGWNSAYGATQDDCPAFGDGAMPTADSFILRRASVAQSTPPLAVGPLRVCSSRASGILVNDPEGNPAPACTAAFDAFPTAQVNDLLVTFFYISQDSEDQPGVPSLRRWFLNATPDFQEGEVISGIEDMQVQFGVDPSGGYGPTNGAATQYLNPGPTLDALLNAPEPAQIVSVRVWLLVRADTPEVGFTDDRIYEYGSRVRANGVTGDLRANPTLAYQPSLDANEALTGAKRYRRVLVSRTIFIRNAVGT